MKIFFANVFFQASDCQPYIFSPNHTTFISCHGVLAYVLKIHLVPVN